MAELKALCMSCRDANKKTTMQVMKDPKVEKNSKGRYSARGTCSKCGGKQFRFLSEADAKGL